MVEEDPGLMGNLLVERMVGAHVELVSKEEYKQYGSEVNKFCIETFGSFNSLSFISVLYFTVVLILGLIQPYIKRNKHSAKTVSMQYGSAYMVQKPFLHCVCSF